MQTHPNAYAPTTSLAELARARPGATRVFMRHHLDFCCGGQRSLADACDRAGIDPASVWREIEEESARDAGGASDWAARPLADLVDHIEQHHHAYLRRAVPPLLHAAARVEKVHADKPDVPSGLAALLTAFWAEMQDHMGKEEQILFPMIRQGARGRAVYPPVRVMEQEHDEHGETLAQVRRLTGDLRVPAHACATWTALYDGLEALEADLMQHIHLENNIVFPRAVNEG
jgi:regulator of cell morphogenesis and NO signaling